MSDRILDTNTEKKEKKAAGAKYAKKGPQRPSRGPGHGPPGMMVEKPKNFKGTFRKLLAYLKGYVGQISFVLVLVIASTMIMLMSPRILGDATNEMAIGLMAKSAVSSLEQAEESPQIKQMYDALGITPLSQCGTAAEKADSLERLVGAIVSGVESGRIEAGEADQIIQLSQSEYFPLMLKNIAATGGAIDMGAIGTIALKLIIIYAVYAVLTFFHTYMMVGITQKIVFKMRNDINVKLTKLPLKYFDSQTHGEILSRVTNDIETISQSMQQTITQAISSVVSVVAILVLMFSISGYMTLIALATLPVMLLLSGLIAKKSQKYFRGQQVSLGSLNSHVEEMYSCHDVVKAYNYEEKSIEEFEQINGELYKNGWRAQFISGTMMPLTNFISRIGYIGVCIVGGVLASDEKLLVGSIQSFIQYLNQFNQPISQASQIVNLMQSTIAAAERVFDILDQAEQSPDAKGAPRIENPKGLVEFKNIRFGYDPEKTLINDISFTAQPGQTIAIVGPTGAGKTTLVNLLMRFYELDGGSIVIDGVETAKMNRSDLRSMFGMVLQDTWLFTGSIRENIAYGNEDADADAVVQAAKAASANHFIRTLSEGYDTQIKEDAGNISQGQRQLMTIARAVLKDPQILILDEATSSVDTRTELLIQKAMARLMEGRTSFVIAHRLSTIRNADLILVMNHGDIIETGTHEQLLDAGGFYASLYMSQFSSAEAE